MIVLGIDPGLDGALVVLDKIPLYQKLTAALCPDGYLPEAMAAAVTQALELGAVLAVLERGGVRPGEGISSGYKIGVGWGLWRGILAGRVRVIEPTASSWTRKMLRDQPGEGKERAIAVASQIPGLHLTPGKRRKPHSGLADAACLARYGQIWGQV